MAKKGKRKAAPATSPRNRQAAFRYNLLEKFEAGIVLQGSEVKSLRDGGVQLKDAYADVTRRRGVAAQHAHRALQAARARTTTPSARASCCCTAARSSA